MIVGLCGYGYTGSGAVLDMLKEYDVFEIIEDFELELIYKPDGIESLEYFLMQSPSRFFESDTAIRRFLHYTDRMKLYYDKQNKGKEFKKLVDRYVDEIVQVKWKGSCAFHQVECDNVSYYFKYRFLKDWGRRFKKYLKIKNADRVTDMDMYLSVQPENFYSASKKLITDLINLKRKNNDKIVVLDQPFSGDNPYKSFVYFDEPKAIMVDKDPRDMYLLAKTVLGARGSFIPTETVEQFIEYYLRIMTYRDKCKKESDSALYLHFEDLIYDPDNSRKIIEKFLGIKNHRTKDRYFFPEKSINNTQLFLRTHEFDSDIQKIEEVLGNWLYNFEAYDLKPDMNGVSF